MAFNCVISLYIYACSDGDGLDLYRSLLFFLSILRFPFCRTYFEYVYLGRLLALV